jgi:iron complex outermembrane recepter protein
MGYSKKFLRSYLAAAAVVVLVVPVHRACADEGEESAAPPFGEQGAASNSDMITQLSEIIVTASKRPQLLREVADSVTAFSGSELTRMGAQSFQDYVGLAPGVIFEQATPGLSNVTIRGVRGRARPASTSTTFR